MGVPAIKQVSLLVQYMRFSQLDRIIALEKGKSITAVKCLSLSEAYLKDHFPRFPIMPGVLMLESMFQSSMWLVRATHDFKYSNVVLRETKSLKFQGFVQPGDSLTVVAEIKKMEGSITNLKVSGSVNGNPVTSGRLVLDMYNLADREQMDPAIDDYTTYKFREFFRRLCTHMDGQTVSQFLGHSLAPS